MSSKRLLRFLIVLLTMLIVGCAHNQDVGLSQIYPTGMTREQAAVKFPRPLSVETRPADGWTREEKSAQDIGRFAGAFEREHQATVQTCEVYWIPRGFMGLGVDWDYLFYGPDDRLIGFRRRFVD